MSGTEGLIASMMITQSIGSIGTAYAQSRAIQAQGNFQRDVSKINAKQAEYQAEDVIRLGQSQIDQLKKDGKRLIGSQRTALAAQGIAIDSGSALAIQESTANLIALDAITIKNNAWRQAWGYKQEAMNATIQGNIASLSARNSANNTLLTGGIRALDYGIRAASVGLPRSSSVVSDSGASGGGLRLNSNSSRFYFDFGD